MSDILSPQDASLNSAFDSWRLSAGSRNEWWDWGVGRLLKADHFWNYLSASHFVFPVWLSHPFCFPWSPSTASGPQPLPTWLLGHNRATPLHDFFLSFGFLFLILLPCFALSFSLKTNHRKPFLVRSYTYSSIVIGLKKEFQPFCL